MKKPKPPKIETATIPTTILDRYRSNTELLHQVTVNVLDFAEGENDNVVDCVLRLLEKYHSAKAEVYELQRRFK